MHKSISSQLVVTMTKPIVMHLRPLIVPYPFFVGCCNLRHTNMGINTDVKKSENVVNPLTGSMYHL